jgi:hypothetical protein
MKQLTINGFLVRLLFAMIIVGLTWNPTKYNYIAWLIVAFTPLKGLLGVILVIGWVIYIRATLRSLGAIGLGLAIAFFAIFIWVLVDYDVLTVSRGGVFAWVLDVVIAFILAIGMSWSHIRRRMSGQVDNTQDSESSAE